MSPRSPSRRRTARRATLSRSGRAATLTAARAAADASSHREETGAGPADGGAVDGGTLVVVNGPRFSSRAESIWHAAQGWSVVGMTGQPEAAVARELGLCYTAIALVTDHDAGIAGGQEVTHTAVLEAFAANIERLRALLLRTVERL